jgi:hypothetical protein
MEIPRIAKKIWRERALVWVLVAVQMETLKPRTKMAASEISWSPDSSDQLLRR